MKSDWASYSMDAELALKKMDNAARLENWAEAGRQAEVAFKALDELCLWFAVRIPQA